MIFYTALILCAVITGIFMLKKMPLPTIALCLLSGIAALFAADVMMSLYGNNMPLNALTIGISALGGIPGVILLILLNTFYGK